MPRILVHPDRLRLLAEQWQRSTTGLRSVADRLVAAADGLDWEALQEAGIEEEWTQARKLVSTLMAQAETHSRALMATADRFEKADASGAAAVGQAAEGFAPELRRWREWWHDAQQPLALPRPVVDRLLSLGEPASGASGLAATSLAGLVGVAATSLGGLGSLQPPVPAWQARLAMAAQDAISRASERSEGGGEETEAQRGD